MVWGRDADSAELGSAMLLLTGDTRSKKCVEWLQSRGFGRIWIDHKPTPYPQEPWGFDNGAFRDWKKGLIFDGDSYLRRLDKAYVVGIPYLAVVPDMVAEGLRSLDFSLSWLDRLPKEWPWYLALQDGMGLEDVDSVIDRFAGLFLGGTDRFKYTAWYWRKLSHRHGKPFHYARASTPRKIRHAMASGADSCDSAYPLWMADRLDGVDLALSSRVSTWSSDQAKYLAVEPWREQQKKQESVQLKFLWGKKR